MIRQPGTGTRNVNDTFYKQVAQVLVFMAGMEAEHIINEQRQEVNMIMTRMRGNLTIHRRHHVNQVISCMSGKHGVMQIKGV